MVVKFVVVAICCLIGVWLINFAFFDVIGIHNGSITFIFRLGNFRVITLVVIGYKPPGNPLLILPSEVRVFLS